MSSVSGATTCVVPNFFEQRLHDASQTATGRRAAGFLVDDRLEPIPAIGGGAVEQTEELLLQPLRDRAALAFADRDLVDGAHGRDLRGRARQEHLVGDVQHLARNVLLEHLDAGGLRETHDGVTRDARQNRRGDGRRVELAVLDQEQVLAGAFADEAGRVQREPLGEAEAARLERHERARQIVTAGFGEGRDRVRRDALPRRDADVDALLERGFAEIRAPFPCSHRHARGLVDVAGHAHLAITAERDRPDVGAVQEGVLANDVATRRHEHVERERDLDAIDLRGVIETPNVVGQSKAGGTGRRLVDAYPFEYRRAVVQRMTQHVHGGLLPRHQLPFMPDVLARLEGHIRS